eukprot:TRINITY_DN6443_c0_g1_i1.p3 TRINITY_DN6443_c0_g1~~TRINITY_DN6443_c0_g1_i1.p3  ORF type:complete len:150 (-),score=45.46 TRINITY_DN6443_c0_g1_i1:142-591(-)
MVRKKLGPDGECLNVFDNAAHGMVLGSLSLADKLVVFDAPNLRIGMVPFNCTALPDLPRHRTAAPRSAPARRPLRGPLGFELCVAVALTLFAVRCFRARRSAILRRAAGEAAGLEAADGLMGDRSDDDDDAESPAAGGGEEGADDLAGA